MNIKRKLASILLAACTLGFVACNGNNPETPDPNQEGNEQTGDTTKVDSTQTYLFQVSPTVKVVFAPGNLQYNADLKLWRFAENQYDYIGNNNENISAKYDGWIDLFGWGTANDGAKYSTDDADYSTFTDWGKNQIGDYAANTWRTLTSDEWYYLFCTRPNAANLFCLGTVNGVKGAIILPEGWNCPSGVTLYPSTSKGLTYNENEREYWNDNSDNYLHNTITLSQWQQMEQAGAVFLPAAGSRNGAIADNIGKNGYYWSSSKTNDTRANALWICSGVLGPQYYFARHYGLSVRLVQDPTATPTPDGSSDTDPDDEGDKEGYKECAFSVSGTKTVYFSAGNLQYNPNYKMWRFAKYQYDFIGEDNNNISETYNGWIDLFGWGTGSNPTLATEVSSNYSVFTDWGTNAIDNYAANTWRTLTNDEWKYVFSSRTDAKTHYGYATVNDIPGIILLPDTWELPDGLTFLSGKAEYTNNIYTAAQWSKMETAGAVFLPITCMRKATTTSGAAEQLGAYWTASSKSTSLAYFFNFKTEVYYFSSMLNYLGMSVRLARDTNPDTTDDGTEDKGGSGSEDQGGTSGEGGSGDQGGTSGGGSENLNPEDEGIAFSVSATSKVAISTGNLQYQASTDTWRFAEHQYDYMGEDNKNISETYSGWIDYFNWGTGDAPLTASENFSDTCDATFVDWGINVIGDYAANTWRTPTFDEWKYILETRSNASHLYGFATVNKVKGFILLPDKWVKPSGVSFTAGNQIYSKNTYTTAQWAVMESAGAIFLPAAGIRTTKTSTMYIQERGFYWSSTPMNHNTAARVLDFQQAIPRVSDDSGHNNCGGISVRLVRDL